MLDCFSIMNIAGGSGLAFESYLDDRSLRTEDPSLLELVAFMRTELRFPRLFDRSFTVLAGSGLA